MSSGARLHESIQDVVLAASIPGVVASVLFLVAVAYLQWNPVSRPHLNRISFRLLVYALIANVVFGSQMLVQVLMKERSPGCSFVVFLCMAAPFFSACMFFCVALNLQLVLVYGVNGNNMEKYYFFGAVFLSGACIIPIWAAGKLGWYAPTRQCWLKDPTPKGPLDWLIATQYAPMLLMSAVEVLSFINMLIFMLRQVSKIQRLRADTSESRSVIATLASSTAPKHPIVKFRPIIIRIALYPLLSCFFSITMSVFSVYTGMYPNLTHLNMTLRILNSCIYSFRPLLYVLLAATDPSFLRAVRSLRAQPLSQCAPPQRDHSQTVSFQWSSKQPPGKCSRTSSIAPKPSFVGDCERRPSAVEEAYTEEELQSEKIAHQL
ncbi:hypothetical protein B0H13DRAFT_1097402 [Mycena leptocephala]|nr:hypothetical protein B0H13DRAFT_1097402 [Mycena leptocephala]